MDCGLGAAAHLPNFCIAVIVQRIEQKPLLLGVGAEGQHCQNFIQRFLLTDQFFRGGAVGQNALGGNYVLVTLAPVPVPPLLPVKAPLGALGQLPQLVKGSGILLIAVKTQKSGGSDFLKAAASGVTILLLVRWLFSFAVVQQFCTLCSYL